MSENRAFGLPLLTKELIEQSNRARTYVIRSLYAILLFGFATLIFWGSVYSRVNSAAQILGKGRELFQILMALQICGIALFTPALTCGAITAEKERNTFGLLLLTRLGPWTILLEKYLGRLFVMGTYLLISLPLFGFCYSLGGVEQEQVWYGFYGLIVMVIQLAALGLLCSTYFRTTVGAFIATYLVGIALFFGPVILVEVLRIDWIRQIGAGTWESIGIAVQSVAAMGKTAAIGLSSLFGFDGGKTFQWEYTSWNENKFNSDFEAAFMFFCPPLIMEATDNVGRTVPAWQIIAFGIPSLMSSALFLLMARACVVWRAFVSPQRYLFRFFQVLDALLHRANQNRFTKGIVLIREESKLPVYEPIAWRETTKTSLGTFRYLVRVFLVLEFPVVAISVVAISMSGGGYNMSRHEAIVFINFLCWIIAILLTVVRAATLVSAERAHQTLDVLLTTPITSHEFIRQKFRGVSRVMVVVAVPLITGMLMQAWFASISHGFRSNESPLIYLLTGVSSVAICLPMFAWFSFFLGMWFKSTTKAIFASLGLIVAWMVIPPVLVISIFEIVGIRPGSDAASLLVISPAAVPLFNEVGELDDLSSNEWVPVLLHFALTGAALFAFRMICLQNGARMLGRSEDDWTRRD